VTELRITRADLDAAVARGTITPAQADALWGAWSRARTAVPAVAPRFSVTHVLYYLGGTIAIGAMSLFMNHGWERFGPWGLLAIVVVYAAAASSPSSAASASRPASATCPAACSGTA
jgi:hypothetical protein